MSEMTEDVERADPDDLYIESARRDPGIQRQNKSILLALSFHLWCLTREELDQVTVEGLRARRHILHGYITDDEIAEQIRLAQSRQFIPLPDSQIYRGPGNWRALGFSA